MSENLSNRNKMPTLTHAPYTKTDIYQNNNMNSNKNIDKTYTNIDTKKGTRNIANENLKGKVHNS
jgi:hypothetical protein